MSILVQDNFTDTDGTHLESHTPNVGGAWNSGIYEDGWITINASNQAYGEAPYGSCINATSLGADSYAQIDIITPPSGAGQRTVLALRCGNNGGTSTIRRLRYDLYLDYSGILIRRSDGNGNHYTLLNIGGTVDAATYKFEVVGTTLTAYKNGVSIGSIANATLDGSAGDFTSLDISSGSVVVDNFIAGGVALPPADPTLLTATCSTGIGESILPQSPGAYFTVDASSGLAPLTVQFTDHSTNTPTSWLWEFGDGTTSTSQNPEHVLATAGIYTPRLTATNDYGSTTYRMIIFVLPVAVVEPPDGGTLTGGGSIQGSLGIIGWFAVDTPNHVIKMYSTTGTLLKTAGGLGQAIGKFYMPTTCAVINGRQLLDRVIINES